MRKWVRNNGASLTHKTQIINKEISTLGNHPNKIFKPKGQNYLVPNLNL